MVQRVKTRMRPFTSTVFGSTQPNTQGGSREICGLPPGGKVAAVERAGKLGPRHGVGAAPGRRIEGRAAAVVLHHDHAVAASVVQLLLGGVIHGPVQRLGPFDHGGGNVPERTLQHPPRGTPGAPSVVTGDEVEILVGGVLDEHQEPAVEHERSGLRIGQGRHLFPRAALVVAEQHAHGALDLGPAAAPLGRGDEQAAVVQPGHVGVVKEVHSGVRDPRGDDVLLGERLHVGVGHFVLLDVAVEFPARPCSAGETI